MDYIQTSNKQIDKFGAGAHGFSPGNPTGGVPATFCSPEFFDDLMMEVINVIKAASLVPAAATRNQLLLALRAAGVFQTPPQFDNGTKAATTGFVKAQGLQASTLQIATTSGFLGASHAGGTLAINSASNTTQTLPAVSAMPAGSRIEAVNINTGVGTVTRNGTDTIRVNQGTVASIALGAGDYLTLESDGVSSWHAVGGSARLGTSAVFDASKNVNGYQKLPSGLILQWGTAVAVAQSTVASITFPIAFPTACRNIQVTTASSVNNDWCPNVQTKTASGFSFGNPAGNSNSDFFWHAIGD